MLVCWYIGNILYLTSYFFQWSSYSFVQKQYFLATRMDAGPRIHHLPAVHQEGCQQILSHNHGSGQFIPKWKEPHIGDTYTPIFHKKKHDCGFGIRGIALQVLVTRLYLNKWLQSLVYETTWVDFRECNTGSAGTRGAWLWAPYRRDPEKKTSGINPPSPKGWTEKFREIFPGFQRPRSLREMAEFSEREKYGMPKEYL